MDIYKIYDDGIIGIVDIEKYKTFVHKNWEYDQLIDHFKVQMASMSLQIWGTGHEGIWNVGLQYNDDLPAFFRKFTGGISVGESGLFITTYSELSSVAMFRDEILPHEDSVENLISIEPGNYKIIVSQIFDPESEKSYEENLLHFIVNIFKDQDAIPIKEILWDENP